MTNEIVTYFETERNPLPLNYIAKSILDLETIIAAINPRATEGVIRGILRAAKKKQAVVIFELALSEMSLSGGYTGYTPKTFAERVHSAAKKEKWFAYALHADHVTVKKGTEEEIETVKQELIARIDAGFTGYAIDTSFLYNKNASDVEGQLEDIIDKGLIFFDLLEEKMNGKPYGIEGEIGEITGSTEYSTPEEAVHYLNILNEHGIALNFLAIANGSKHGVNVDADGNVIPQLGINIKRTIEVVKAIEKAGYDTKIAQHGITGTPVETIAETFPHGKIAKGNIGTHWQRIVYAVLEEKEPALYERMREWVLNEYADQEKDEHKIWASNSKRAWKPFFDKVERIGDEAKQAIIEKAQSDMFEFIGALKMEKTADACYKYIKENELENMY